MAIAFFSTWTTYGTSLPGDERGWFESVSGFQAPDLQRKFQAALLLSEDAFTLDPVQRQLVEKTIADHCAKRKWTLHAVNCRSNHVHVVVTAPNRDIEIPREQFKAWCTRKLKELEQDRHHDRSRCTREHWWTERGWDIYIDDVVTLLQAKLYVLEGQDS